MLRHLPSPHRPGCHSSRALPSPCCHCVPAPLTLTRCQSAITVPKAPCRAARARTAAGVSSRASTVAAPSPLPRSRKLKRSIWTAVDVAALLGSVGGALAALLGVVSPTYALTLPLVLPVVSLIAALQREDLTNEEGRQYLSELSSSLGRDSAALLSEAAAAVEEVRRETRGQSATAARLIALEDKLAVLEGAVVGAARNSREAAVGISALGSALQQTLQQNPAGAGQGGPIMPPQMAQMLAGIIASEVVPLVKAELAGALGPWLAESNAALRRLDTRLAVVEGSLAGLEQAQSAGLMRLSNTLSSSLTDAQAALQSSVRVEVATAVEPLRQLPQLVAAAAAKAAAQQQQQQSPLGSLDEQQLAAGGAVGQALSVSGLREMVAAEVSTATQQLLSQQGDIISTLGQPPRPTPLAEDQWEALGRRLARLERLVQSIPELGEQAVAGQLAPLVAAQQAAAETQETVITTVTSGLASVANQVSQGLTQVEDLVQSSVAGGVGGDRLQLLVGQLEQTGQQLGLLTSQMAGLWNADSSLGSLQQMLQQLVLSVQQQVQQLKGQGPSLFPPAAAGDTAQVVDLLLALQQQTQGLAAALQQVQMDIPVQVGLAVSQAGAPAGAFATDSNNAGAVFSSGDLAAVAAAAGAATTAAEGIAEVRQILGNVQQVCGELQVQVGSLVAQVAEQQAFNVGSTGQEESAAGAGAVLEAAQQQLAAVATDISRNLSEQLRESCNSLELQLQELQHQLTSAAAAAKAQAVSDVTAAADAQSTQPLHEQELDGSIDGPDASHEQQQQAVRTGGVTPAGVDSIYQAQLNQQQQRPSYEQTTADGWYPHQQQYQSVPPALEAAGGLPAAAGVNGNARTAADAWPGTTTSGTWPDMTAAAAIPQQQQLHEQAGSIKAATPQPSPLQQQQLPAVMSLPDPAALTDEQLRTEGLHLLRAGREATRGSGPYTNTGPDFAAAEMQLQAAVACFSRAVGSSPQDTRALGNLGNALLAQGELKKGLLDELRLAAVQGGLAAAGMESLGVADTRLRGEASGLLTRAGEIFRRVLEVDGWSSRALVNWGKAMVGRAELAVEPTAAIKLYNAAIDKFEAVLEEDPSFVVAKYRCALAMQGLAGLQSGAKAGGADGQGSRQQLVLLSDAANYLSDIVSSEAGAGDDGLQEAAASALRQVQQQLEMLKLAWK